MVRTQPAHRGLNIHQVGFEIGVGKISLAVPQSCEIKTKDAEPMPGQVATDANDRFEIFGASKTVAKQGKRMGRDRGHVNDARQSEPR